MWRPVKDKHSRNLNSVLKVRPLLICNRPPLLKGRALDSWNVGTVCLTAGRTRFQEVRIRQDGDF